MSSKKKVILRRVHLRNFLSFGDNWTTVDLNVVGNNLILGENRDIGEEGSRNGVGKTTILQAISVALFNQPITKIKVNNLINATNKKAMEIKLEFTTDWNNNDYMIHVGQKPDFVHIYDVTHDNKDIAHDSKAEVTKQIQELIGIDKNTFRYVCLFSASGEAFLDLSATEQREIIESLFDMDIITEKADGVSKLKAELKKDLDFEQYKIKTDTESNERAQKMIKTVEDNIIKWDKKNKDDIAVLETTLVSIGAIDHTTLTEEIQLVDSIMEYTDLIRNQDTKIKQSTNDMNALKTKYTNTKKEITKLDDEIIHLQDDNCPYCKQGMPNAKEKLIVKRGENTKKTNIYNSELDQYNKLKLIHDELEAERAKLLAEQKVLQDARLYDNLDKIRKLVAEKDNIIASIAELKVAVNPHIQHFENIKKEAIVNIDLSKLEQIQDDYDHADFLLKLLNNKNSFIRKRIIGQVIPFMNSQLALYIDRLGLPHNVRFENDLTASITQFGRDMCFGNLSTGERQRVNLALSFAFRDVLSSLHTEFNVLLLDEVLDSGLDEVGVYNTISVLNDMIHEKHTCVYLISHRQEVANMVDRTIHVVKEHGFSQVVE